MSCYPACIFLGHPFGNFQNCPNTSTHSVSCMCCDPPRLIKSEHEKLETSSHSSNAHYISRECAFFLSIAASKTLLTDRTPCYTAPRWVPGSLLAAFNFWISFPCCWPGCQPQRQSRAHSSTKGSRDVNLLPKWPFTLIHGQTKKLEWRSVW